MATNVVEILIEARRGATTAITQTTAELTSFQNALAGVGGKIGILSLLGTAAVAAGVGLAKMGLAMAENVEQLDRLSRNTGTAVDKLVIARQIVKEGGGDFGQLSTALSFMNKAIAEGNPLLAQLGITTRDAFEAIVQLGAAFRSSDDAAKKNLIAQQLLSRGGKELISDIENLSAAYGRNEAALRASGIVPTEQMLESARKLDKQMDLLGRNWAATVTKMAGATVGPLNAILAFFNHLDKGIVTALAAGAGADVTRAFTHGGGRGEESGAGGGSAADALANVRADAEAPREKRIKELARLLRMTEAEATRALNKLEALDDRAKRSEVLQKLGTQSLEQMLAAERGETGAGNIKPRGTGQRPVFDIGGFAAEPQMRESGFQRGLSDWRETVREVLSTAELMRTSLGAVWNGLHSGFAAVFQGLLQKGQTFKSAMGTLFRALAQEILAALASIVASKLFGLFLKIVGVVASGGGGAVAGGGFDPLAGGFLSRSPAPTGGSGLATSSARGGGNTYNIWTLDARPVVHELASGSGSIRRAEDRLRFQGAY